MRPRICQCCGGEIEEVNAQSNYQEIRPNPNICFDCETMDLEAEYRELEPKPVTLVDWAQKDVLEPEPVQEPIRRNEVA